MHLKLREDREVPLEGHKKDNFLWNTFAQAAFDALKTALTTALVLALPNFFILFEIECDTSGRGISIVLMQYRRPVAYFSRALSDRNDRNLAKSAYENDIIALVLANNHW